MKIAFISYEYPPDTALGGIGTYIFQISRLMVNRGHYVEIFSATLKQSYTSEQDNITVHRVYCENRSEFKKMILGKFTERHYLISFDFFESPEYGADGYLIKLKFPELPLLVKLHTPTFLLHELSNKYVKLIDKFRFIAGGLLRGQIVKPFWIYDDQKDSEYEITKLADRIQSPSVSLGNIISAKWNIPRDKIKNIPYPFTPNNRLLDLKSNIKAKQNITYLGRLELRKGLLEYIKVIPILSKKYPELRFTFVGQDTRINKSLTFKKYILTKLNSIKDKLDFYYLPYDRIYEAFEKSEIIILPSLWENFPNVCLEAMSAGKCVLGSENGGMMDMLSNPSCGVLINPFDHSELVEKFIDIYENDEKRIELSIKARDKIENVYHEKKIGKLIENDYKAILTK